MGCSKCQIAWPNGIAERRGTDGTGESRILAQIKKIEAPSGLRRNRSALLFLLH